MGGQPFRKFGHGSLEASLKGSFLRIPFAFSTLHSSSPTTANPPRSSSVQNHQKKSWQGRSKKPRNSTRFRTTPAAGNTSRRYSRPGATPTPRRGASAWLQGVASADSSHHGRDTVPVRNRFPDKLQASFRRTTLRSPRKVQICLELWGLLGSSLLEPRQSDRLVSPPPDRLLSTAGGGGGTHQEQHQLQPLRAKEPRHGQAPDLSLFPAGFAFQVLKPGFRAAAAAAARRVSPPRSRGPFPAACARDSCWLRRPPPLPRADNQMGAAVTWRRKRENRQGGGALLARWEGSPGGRGEPCPLSESERRRGWGLAAIFALSGERKEGRKEG